MEKSVSAVQKKGSFIRYMKKNWALYVFLLPALIYVIVLHYLPMYGIQIAFKNYNAIDGIWGSEFVGWYHFKTFLNSPQFKTLLTNTLVISLYQLVAGFPIPIIFALLLNYTSSTKLRKTSQMITYAPHFISEVVFVGMIQIFLQNNGVVNQVIAALGGQEINFLGNPQYFRNIYVWSGVLKSMGFSSIIYISVLTSVAPELHEAATVDGASKLQRVFYVDLPHLLPTATILLIMRVGSILNIGFEKAFLLQTNVNIEFSEIISTYVYKVGLQGSQFSYSAAIGLFNNVINVILLLIVNKVAKKLSDTSLF